MTTQRFVYILDHWRPPPHQPAKRSLSPAGEVWSAVLSSSSSSSSSSPSSSSSSSMSSCVVTRAHDKSSRLVLAPPAETQEKRPFLASIPGPPDPIGKLDTDDLEVTGNDDDDVMMMMMMTMVMSG
jgi:hypothetical protein